MKAVVHKAALPKTETCVSCHMPKRRGEFAVHIVLTDHYIQREKPARDLLAPLSRRPASSNNKTMLAPYYPEKLRDHSDDQLYMAIAESENAANLQGATALESTIKAVRSGPGGILCGGGGCVCKERQLRASRDLV